MRRLMILTLFFGLLFSSSFGYAESPKLTPQQTNNHWEKKGNQVTNHSDKIPVLNQTVDTDNSPHNCDHCADKIPKTTFWQKTSEDPISCYTFWLTLFTLVLAGSTIGLWLSTRATGNDIEKAATAAKRNAAAALQAAIANKLATRAYIRISSCSPGVIFSASSPLACKLEIKNYGETPAHITNIVIQMKIRDRDQQLPDIPDYSSAKIYVHSASFLVRGENIFYNFIDKTITPKEIIGDFKDGRKVLCLYGFVDYTDVFGDNHRGGFGQNYYPANDERENYPNDDVFKARNNLTFLMQTGYNYDRSRKDGEGRS